MFVNRLRSASMSTLNSDLFAADQSLGPFFNDCIQTLIQRGLSLSLSDRFDKEHRLADSGGWNAFVKNYLHASTSLETDRARAEALHDSLGIGLGNFVRLLEDLYASELVNTHCDFHRGSEAANLVRLYEVGEVYGLIPESAGENAFIKPPDEEDWPWRARLAPGSDNFVELEVTPALYPRFVLNASEGLFGRDREEFEAHANFEPSDDAWLKFRNYATVEIWIPLDLADLQDGFWNDSARMSLLHRYNNPLHLEIDKKRTPPYHSNNEDFLEVYLDSEDRILTKGRMSLRARIREEQQRALVQFREEMPELSPDGRVVRQEWERRIETNYFGDQNPSLDRLVEIAQFGWYGGIPMSEARRLLQRLIDRGLHNRRKNLFLTQDVIIYQKRRRTHLELDTIELVRNRLEMLAEMATRHTPVPPPLYQFIGHVRSQLTRLETVREILVKYAFNRMISGEAVLISQDRWAVFEPGAYGKGKWPNSFEDGGQRGRGIRVEAELANFSSDQLQLTLREIQVLIDAGTGDPVALERERRIVKSFQESLFEDVKTTVEIQASKLRNVCFVELQGLPKSKALLGQAMIADGQGGFRRGHRYWL